MPVIETERTLLREFRLEDAEAVLKFNVNTEVTRYTGDAGMIKTLDDAKRVIQSIWLKEYQEYGYGRWAVVDKASGDVVGFCGFKYFPSLGMPDIGYRFLPEYWGKGLATETAFACVDFAKQNLAFTRYFADVMPDNIASKRVIEKLGLTYSETIQEDGIDFLRYANF